MAEHDIAVIAADGDCVDLWCKTCKKTLLYAKDISLSEMLDASMEHVKEN